MYFSTDAPTSHNDLKIRQAETFEEDALTGVELAGGATGF